MPTITLVGLSAAQKRALAIADKQARAERRLWMTSCCGWNSANSCLDGFDSSLIPLPEAEIKYMLDEPDFAPGSVDDQGRLMRSAPVTCPECGYALSRPELRLDWCSHEAAPYACEQRHYSRTIPKPKIATPRFRKIHVYWLGYLRHRSCASCDGRRYGLRDKPEVAELVRVALTEHQAAVSRIVSIAARLMAGNNLLGLLLVSYADPARKHHGGIYQAAGPPYCVRSSTDFYAIDLRGRKMALLNMLNVGHQKLTWRLKKNSRAKPMRPRLCG